VDPILLVRNAFFLAAGVGYQNVLEILPDIAMFPEIDLDRDLLALLVCHIMDSRHQYLFDQFPSP
jgi:hypothetical protein